MIFKLLILIGCFNSALCAISSGEFYLDDVSPTTSESAPLSKVEARSLIECSTLCMAEDAKASSNDGSTSDSSGSLSRIVGETIQSTTPPAGCKSHAYSQENGLCYMSPMISFDFAGAVGGTVEVFRGEVTAATTPATTSTTPTSTLTTSLAFPLSTSTKATKLSGYG